MAEQMSQPEIIERVLWRIDEEIRKEHDVEYPSKLVLAILDTMDTAADWSFTPVGWGPASAIALNLVRALKVELPEELLAPLEGRLPR